MTWMFDQAPNVACITNKKIIAGEPVLVVTHYEDDHSWAFLDGAEFDPADALVVSMSECWNFIRNFMNWRPFCNRAGVLVALA